MGNDEKPNGKSPLMGPEIEALAKDVVVAELHLVYIYQKDKPFDGELKMSGQLGRKGQCYMMMELAKQFIADFDPAKQGSGIIVAKDFPGIGGRG